MPSSKRPFLVDEELGKKDDDHRPRMRPLRMPPWTSPRPRRLLLAIIGLYFVYIFFKNMPTDLPPAAERYNPELAQARRQGNSAWPPSDSSSIATAQGPPPRNEKVEGARKNTEDYYYDEKVTLNALTASLGLLSMRDTNHAIVFAGASLESASDLIPLACQMARWKTNVVHFMLMGRDDVSIGGIKQVNGVNDIDCPVLWHDGRPDYAPWSTDSRMGRAVVIGLSRLQSIVHPRAVITQGNHWEDSFFCNAVAEWARDAGVSHISLPTASRDVMWMSTLDDGALQVWNEVSFEMVIHAPSESSGSMIRLIRSLQSADYLGSIPSLTIELPSNVDSELLRFLRDVQWPPGSSNKVTLRRRVQPHGMGPTESSIRTVEAFYPRNPDVSHVLVLSPQTELSPSFYHYLKYSTLYYKHNVHSNQEFSKLLGISLELPSTKPTTGDEPLSLPPPPPGGNVEKQRKETLPHFLWQAPNSNAALYFGDKWAEFHSFLSKRFTFQDPKSNPASHEKLISKKYPAFMEYLLEMTRAKGYFMLYPSFSTKGTFSLVTVHNDLYRPPEESVYDPSSTVAEELIEGADKFSKRTDDEPIRQSGPVKKPLNPASSLGPFLEQFPLGLPQMDSLDLLSFNGDILSGPAYGQSTQEYAKQFRTRHGGCHADSLISGESSPGQDLFCLDEK